MEQSFADLLSGSFSETSVLSFPDGDLDIDHLKFDERFEEDKTDIATKEDVALHQEATGQTAVLSSKETKDVNMTENVDKKQSGDKNDKEDFQSVGVMSMDITPEEDYTSSDGDSEQEVSVSGEEEEDEEEDMGTGEKPWDLLMSVRCSDEPCDGNKEDRIFAEGQPLAPEGTENPQVRNEEQGESESDEEVCYFERVPERGSEMMIKADEIEQDKQEREEEKQEDSSDSECEGMKIDQEENLLALCFEREVENPCSNDPMKATLEFPEASRQNLQDVIAEVDSEEYEEKMKDFSGDEHQEAGESFADYPSDFSSCEYVQDGGKNQESKHQNALAYTSDSGSVAKQSTCLDRDVIDVTWMEIAEHTDEAGDECLYSIDLEVDADKFRNVESATGEKGKEKAKTTIPSNQGSLGDNFFFNTELETTGITELGKLGAEHTDEAGDECLYSIDLEVDADKFRNLESAAGEKCKEIAKTTSPSNQGSLDDSFFFNTELEASGITELGQFGDDEYEEERNWEQEQERIKAFYDFYDDSDGENGGEGRQSKVQFCTNPLSQVMHYETDSDRESLSSSTEGEQDLSSTEASEELREPDDTMQMKPARDPPNTQLPETVPDVSNTQICTRKHKCLSVLKLILKMGVVIIMGLLMFWMATYQMGWFSQASFF